MGIKIGYDKGYTEGRASRDAEVEALQARVAELDNDTADLAMLADQYKAERDKLQARVAELEGESLSWKICNDRTSDAARDLKNLLDAVKAERDTLTAKLAALEGQPAVGYVTSGYFTLGSGRITEYSDSTFKVPLFAAAGAQSPTALEYVTGYSDGKAWAEGQAQPWREPVTREQWEGACNGLGTQGRGGSV